MIQESYYAIFSRFLYLMERSRNNYNYGMAVTLFTFTIALFVLPVVSTLLSLLGVPPRIFFWTVLVSFIFIWILNYVSTIARHKALYGKYLDKNERKKKYSVLLITLIGMVWFVGYNIIILRR